MPVRDDPTIAIDHPRPAFRRANPEAFTQAQGDVDTLQRLGTIETRAADAKERFRTHFEKHQDGWIAAEALRLARNRNFPTLEHPKPRGFERDTGNVADLMIGQARRNVNARALIRLASINTVKTRLQNAVVRNRPDHDRQIRRRKQQQSNDSTGPNNGKGPNNNRRKGPDA